jgi:hypothetical protein
MLGREVSKVDSESSIPGDVISLEVTSGNISEEASV